MKNWGAARRAGERSLAIAARPLVERRLGTGTTGSNWLDRGDLLFVSDGGPVCDQRASEASGVQGTAFSSVKRTGYRTPDSRAVSGPAVAWRVQGQSG